MQEPATETRPVRIGAVSYLNTRPLVEGLEKCRDVELSFDVPSRLLGALLEERADVALAPILDAMQSPEPLAVLPVGCIASDGATRSVKVFSRAPFNKIRHLVADPDSKTSVALATVLLTRVHGASPTISRAVQSITAMLEDGITEDAVLMIGDKVERRAPDASEFPHVLDLGGAWKEWTGLPFVFAAWVCQSSRAEAEVVRRAARLLDRQRRHNRSRIGWVAHHCAEAHGWTPHDAQVYLDKTICTELCEHKRASIERFCAECAESRLIECDRHITWMS